MAYRLGQIACDEDCDCERCCNTCTETTLPSVFLTFLDMTGTFSAPPLTEQTGNADELPATVDDASELNDIEFYLGDLQCTTGADRTCIFAAITTMLDGGDSIDDIDVGTGKWCDTGNNSPNVRYASTPGNLEIESRVFVFETDSGAKYLGVEVQDQSSDTTATDTNHWHGFVLLAASGRVACSSIDEEIPLVRGALFDDGGCNFDNVPAVLSMGSVRVRMV